MNIPHIGKGASAAERIELHISASCAGVEADLVVRVATSDPVKRLAQELGAKLEAHGEPRLWCVRRGEVLDRDLPLGDAGIRWGDRLILDPLATEPTHLGGKSQVAVLISGGPCAGESFELGEGVYRLGRDSSADLVIADPSISRAHLELRIEGCDVKASDMGSSNGTALNGRSLRPGASVALREGDELEVGRTLLCARPIGSRPGHGVTEHGGHLDFNRPPRVSPPAPALSRELPAPPNPARRGRIPLAASFVPLLTGLLLFLLLKSPVMLIVAAMSPLMALSTLVGDRRGGKKSFAREAAAFRKRLDDAMEELAVALESETATRRAGSPDAPTLMERVAELSPLIWERRLSDSDFMCLRVGVADLPCQSIVTVRDGGDAALRAEADAKLGGHRLVPSVPLMVDLPRVGTLGLVGDRVAGNGLARWLLLQAAILHSPGELVVLAALTESSAEEWAWLKWLPHLRPDRVGLQVGAVAIGRAESEGLLTEVRDLADRRRGRRRAVSGGPRPTEVLLLLDEDVGCDRALVSAALTGAGEAHVAAIWLGREARDLPGQAGAFAELERARAVLAFTDVASGTTVADVSAEAVSRTLAERTARLLAPVQDVGELARVGDIPKRIGLLELLELIPPTAEELERRWARWQGDLTAAVGVAADGIMTLDLRSEGPHALIAGTTGSGKSELLRTFVAAAAAAIPPNRLSFLLVDYKGGAAFAPCAALPHVVDVVSDLDEHLAERALISLNAELKRRERILAEEGAKDLLELARRDVDTAPPLLVIAVDEFAKLREEVPDFVDGVVDIAQRGRSLGVHMVLAAQTLRNAFTPAIRANTNLRLALRVSEETESEDMIASPLAAHIPSGEGYRGRGFSRTGHGELREFQAAYISGLSDFSPQREIQLEEFHFGAPALDLDAARARADSDAESDLVLLGEAACRAQARLKLPVPAPPWLPTLPSVLDLEVVERLSAPTGGVAIGLVDLPHLQRQEPLVLDLESAGHVAVFGASNSGKTTALTSAALALARARRPRELGLYCLDAAGGDLAPLDGLAHCGGVVMADEEERVQRLLRLLLRRIERRGTRAKIDAHEAGPAAAVLLVDDFGSFAHLYDRPGAGPAYELMQRVLASGRAAGVHVIVTAARRGALPVALATHFSQRLILRMTTEEDMLSLGLDAKAVRGARLSVGSGFTQDSHEFHVAVPCDCEAVPRDGEGPTLISLSEAVASISTGDAGAVPRIEVLPTSIPRTSLGLAGSLESIPLGISDEHLGPVAIDLSQLHFLVVGPYRSGRSTALATIAHGMRQADPTAPMYLIAPRRSPLRDLDLWAGIAMGVEKCAEIAGSLVTRLEDGELQNAPCALFVDDGGELVDTTSAMRLERLVRVARDSDLRVVASVEAGAARGIGASWIRELRREGHGLLLDPDLNADGDLLGARLPRHVAAPMSAGRGFLISRGTAELVHVAT